MSEKDIAVKEYKRSRWVLDLFTYDRPSKFQEWTKTQLIGFRASLVFFSLLILPWHWKFYHLIFEVNWFAPHFKSLLDIVSFLPEVLPNNGLGAVSLVNIAIYALIALIAALVWSGYDKSTKEYNLLGYVLVVALRFKIGLGLIAFGTYLLFQQHLPYPSISNLHTDYGDLFAWKVYFQTTAINPEYQSFLGFVEIVTGLLFLFRRTVTIGAGIALGFLGNVFMVNLLYDVGNLPYITFLLLGILYLFARDVPRLYDLFAGKKAQGEKFYPKWKTNNLVQIRKIALSLVLVFVLLLGVSGYSLFNSSYKYPQTSGISGTAGYYEVIDFVFNGDSIPYSLTNTDRWQNVIFEEWTTISIKNNKPVITDTGNGDTIEEDDFNRNYEIAGAGGRHYYHYVYDNEKGTLSLRNKNKNHLEDLWSLNIERPTDSTIVLKGTNPKKDPIQAHLLKVDKRYFMYEGRRSDIEL